MPTTTSRIEPGIYRADWIDNVTLDEIFAARDSIDALAAADNRENFIIVIDGSKVKRIPVEPRMLIKSTNTGAIGILVLNAPLIGEVVGGIFNRLAPFRCEFYRDYDALIKRAHKLLSQA